MSIKYLINYFGIVKEGSRERLDCVFNQTSIGTHGSFIYLEDLENKDKMKDIYDLSSSFLRKMTPDYVFISDHHATQYNNNLMIVALLDKEINQ